MTQPNMIDVVTTNGCPDMTPEQLLTEEVTTEDCRAVERVMGRFNSTTGFLRALKVVLVDLEAFSEAEALDKFIPIMARIESSAANGEPTTTLKLEPTIISETERILRILNGIDPAPKSPLE